MMAAAVNSGGRVALVTGAGNGLGEVIAATLHADGYRIAVADIDEHAAGRVATKLDASGSTAIAMRLDVRSKPDFERARADLVACWGSVQVLVNNAAVTVAKPVMEITADEFDAVLAVNLRGTFLGCQVFGAYFQGAGHGYPKAGIEELERQVHGDLKPDFTLLFDLPIATARERLDLTGKTPDRFESQETDFHERVRAGYHERVAASPERFAVIDSSKPIDEVKADVAASVDAFVVRWNARPVKRPRP